MAIKYKSISAEEGQIILDRLRNDQDYLAKFITSSEVSTILEMAIKAASLQKKVSVDDFVSAIFLYSRDNPNMFPAELDNPGAIYGYFKTTARRLLTNRKFLKTLLGHDPKIDGDSVSIDAKEDDRRSLGESLYEEESDNSAELAAQKVDRFKEIVSLVYDKSLKFGELLQRTYLEGEKAESIARDFMNRGLINNKDLESAVINVQNSLLPRARKQFNEIALDKKFNLTLNGKVKKSEIKQLKKSKLT